MSRRRLISLHDLGSFDVFGDLFDERRLFRQPMALGPGDTIILEGGQDINPKYYGENIIPGVTQKPSNARDVAEQMLIHFGKMSGCSFIGICRGAQFLTAVAGGKLIQDVTGHHGTHMITVSATGGKLSSSSVHHQMMYPFEMPDESYELIAYADGNRSNWYIVDGGDGTPVDIANALPKGFVEPEIVWYKHFKALAIQGHPEFMAKKDPFVQYTRQLVKERIINAAAN